MQRDDHTTGAGEPGSTDAADDALVAKLRALPAEGGEPDWRKLEAAIRAEVAPLAMPMPWWRNWRWLVPIGAMAATAAIVLVVAMRHGEGRPSVALTSTHDASVVMPGEPLGTDPANAVARNGTNAPAMWLD